MAANPAGDVVETLRARVEGQVITAGMPGYDEARRPANPYRVGRPVAVVRPASAGAVAEVIRVVQHTSYPLIVRSGGHSAGHSTGDGVLLDLGSLTGVEVGDGAVWAGSGLTARALTRALAPHARVVGFGDTGGVGIGGITLAGGIGFLSRRYGLTIDNLLGAEIVTADGRIRTIDAEREPDLFWAIRGGGGNFGVVTRFRFRTAPIGQVHGGMLVLPATPETVASLARVAVEADDALAVITNVMPAPPLPFLPTELYGQLIAMARVCHAGEDPSEADAALRPLRELATPLADLITAVPYDSLLEDPPSIGQVIATRSLFLDRIDESDAETLLDHLADSDSMLRLVQFRAQGGAIGRVPADQTAYAYRSHPLMMTTVHDGAGEYAAAQAWVDRLADALYQGNDGVYVGFFGLSPADRVETAYPAATLARLRRIKARYDPGNLFRSNVNIVPDPVPTGTL